MWKIIWILLGILAFIYYICICLVMRKWNSTFSRFWILTGIVLIVSGMINHRVIHAVLAVGMGLFIGTEVLILKAMFQKNISKLPCIIVLGAKVNGTVVSESLRR